MNIHAMELATRLFSTISFLLSLTHRALPNVFLQESAGIGCEHFNRRGEAFRVTSQAWRADLEVHRFSESSLDGLRCVNKPFDGR